MSWEIFEKGAAHYERWYATSRGRRVDRAEAALLGWLLGHFPARRRVLEIGCGTGHFTRWLGARGHRAIGLDRSSAMLRDARSRLRDGALLLADACELPLCDRAVDVSVLVTTLEFLDSPEQALREAVRVSRTGLVLVVLNRFSLGALSRRWGPQARGSLLSEARDLSCSRLREQIAKAAGERLLDLHWRSALLPRPFDRVVTRVPLGDVIGVAAELTRERGR